MRAVALNNACTAPFFRAGMDECKIRRDISAVNRILHILPQYDNLYKDSPVSYIYSPAGMIRLFILK